MYRNLRCLFLTLRKYLKYIVKKSSLLFTGKLGLKIRKKAMEHSYSKISGSNFETFLRYLWPSLIVIGYAILPICLPCVYVKTASPFCLLKNALPYTSIALALVWTGFIFHRIKSLFIKAFLVLLTALSTAIFFYNLWGAIIIQSP
jgi:hypothetical protein